jgi:hypothetical protein
VQRIKAGVASRRLPLRLKSCAAYGRLPGSLRIEQINKDLGTATEDLALPIRKLIADGMISAKGQKRSTQYFPRIVKPVLRRADIAIRVRSDVHQPLREFSSTEGSR